MKEVWKPIKNYENYEAGSCGFIRNTNFHRSGKTKVLKPGYSNKYPIVQLFKNGVGKWEYVHKLVAEAFIPNPLNLPQVNHKDENPDNNFVYVSDDGTVDLERSNLEWCDAQYNMNYGTRTERLREKQLNDVNKSTQVAQFALHGVLIKIDWPSAAEAARNIPHAGVSEIGKCCKMLPKYKTSGGFKWSYIYKSTIPLDDAPCEFEITYCVIPK